MKEASDLIFLYVFRPTDSPFPGGRQTEQTEPNDSDTFTFCWNYLFPNHVTDGLVLLRFYLTVMSPVDQQGSEESFPNLLPSPTDNLSQLAPGLDTRALPSFFCPLLNRLRTDLRTDLTSYCPYETEPTSCCPHCTARARPRTELPN